MFQQTSGSFDPFDLRFLHQLLIPWDARDPRRSQKPTPLRSAGVSTPSLPPHPNRTGLARTPKPTRPGRSKCSRKTVRSFSFSSEGPVLGSSRVRQLGCLSFASWMRFLRRIDACHRDNEHTLTLDTCIKAFCLVFFLAPNMELER